MDYVYHLAGYYGFTQKNNPVYEQTNVTGTRFVLVLSKLPRKNVLFFPVPILPENLLPPQNH